MSTSTDQFNFARFWAYLNKLLVERWRTNALRLAILFGCMLMIELWVSFTTYSPTSSATDRALEVICVVFAIILLVSGCFFATEMLSGARRKAERIGALTFPVTPFENWLARWIICIPLFLLCFLVCMYLADAVRVLFFGPLYPAIEIKFINAFTGNSLLETGIGYAWLVYFSSTAVYALGGVVFVKRAILKTSLALFILYWLGAFVTLIFATVFHFRAVGDFGKFILYYSIFSVPFLWWLSYRCFRDLEIIDDLSFKRSKAWVVGYFAFTLLITNVLLFVPYFSDDGWLTTHGGVKELYLDQTTEKRIAPVSAIAFEDSPKVPTSDWAGFTVVVEVNFVNDVSQCSVIYPEQLIQVKQRGETLYYSLSDTLANYSRANVNFLSGADGTASTDRATEDGEIKYTIKGIDGKERTAIDKHYEDYNKVRIIVNTLPGKPLDMELDSEHKLWLSAGRVGRVMVNGGKGLGLDAQFRTDSLLLTRVSALNLGAAHVDNVTLRLVGNLDEGSDLLADVSADSTAQVNSFVVMGVGRIRGLSKSVCKRIELIPNKGAELSLGLDEVTKKMVIE